MIKIDDQGITARLSKIRQRVGGKQVEFIPPAPRERIDMDMDSERVEDLFHSSDLLIRNGQPVFAYIRDHTEFDSYSILSPLQCKKIHFTVCRTLRNMKQQGRFERYRVTNRKDDRYDIDITKGWGDSEVRQVKLFPCQNCLAKSGYHCFDYSMETSVKRKIIEQFNAKEALNLLWQQFSVFKKAMTGAKSAILPTGYSGNWSEISETVRRSRNYTCEECGIKLDNRGVRQCLDVHHKNADKRNNRDDNLICLCKLCHAGKHPHYQVALSCQEIIKTARRQQLIT